MAAVPFTEEDLHELYLWVDEIPISRPKRNIARDFADGCCVAEIVKFFFPKIVDLHNYAPAMSLSKKRDNWRTLNAKVFRKLYFEVPPEEVEDIVSAVPGAIERFLRALRIKLSQIKAQREEMQQLAGPRGEGRIGWAEPNAAAEGGGELDGPMDRFYGHARGSGGMAGARPLSSRSPAARPHAQPSSQQPQQQQGDGDMGASHPNEQQHLIEEKERTIMELRETVGILSEKIMKLEELIKVKDEKLSQYRAKFGKT